MSDSTLTLPQVQARRQRAATQLRTMLVALLVWAIVAVGDDSAEEAAAQVLTAGPILFGLSWASWCITERLMRRPEPGSQYDARLRDVRAKNEDQCA